MLKKLLALLGFNGKQEVVLNEKEVMLQKIREERANNFPTIKNWAIDTYHSTINFRVMHMGIAEVIGKFKDWKCDFQGTSPAFSDMKLKVTIQAASIETDMVARDMHLKSPEFLDAEKFPIIEFQSTSISWKPLRSFIINGNLTIKGITKPIQLEGQLKNFIPKDMFGFPKVGFQVEGTINRKDWGLTWNMELQDSGEIVVDDYIKLDIRAELATTESIQAMDNFLKQSMGH